MTHSAHKPQHTAHTSSTQTQYTIHHPQHTAHNNAQHAPRHTLIPTCSCMSSSCFCFVWLTPSPIFNSPIQVSYIHTQHTQQHPPLSSCCLVSHSLHSPCWHRHARHHRYNHTHHHHAPSPSTHTPSIHDTSHMCSHITSTPRVIHANNSIWCSSRKERR